ncbi:MAG TPA: hypothetical protein VM261_18865 [Kofleriaceae bacterium]|nr:hypothetical protein [Kofleriaceae bacterium]
MFASPRAVWLAVAIAACGGDAPSVRLVPVGDGACGRPTDARSLLVTPLGDFRAERTPVPLDAPFALGNVPDTTRQLAVEVTGDGATVLAQGKTAPFDFAALADGDTVSVAMAPPDDVCPAGTMATARNRPLVAAVGGGVLVAGGDDGTGPLASAEWFDPATNTFRDVALPAGFGGARGLAGAALVPLSDGTVALVGGPSPGFAIYDHDTGFRPAVLVNQVRAHAAAVAIDDTTVLLLGGCGTLAESGECDAGSALANSRYIDFMGGAITDGPSLAVPRLDGTAFLERQPDGRAAVVVVGGTDGAGTPLTSAERIDLETGAVTVLDNAGAAAARTDAGTLITGFGIDGGMMTMRGTTAALVPGIDVVRPLQTLVARSGTTLVTQEDGLVVGFGGGPTVRFRPASSTWSVIDAPAVPALQGGHAAVRLEDGSIFLVGGRVADVPQAAAYRYRPRLLGPFTGSLTVVPGDDESDPPLSPLDPSLVTATPPPWRLRGAGAAGVSYAVVGGPQGGTLRVDLTATVPAEGVALVLGQVGPGDLHRVVLIPDEEASLERRAAGAATTVCRGSTVPFVTGATAITLDVNRGSARVAIAGQVVLTCDVDPLPAGRVGVGALGTGEVQVVSIAVTRG